MWPAGDHWQQTAVINKQMTSAHILLLLGSDAGRPDPAEGPQGPCLTAGWSSCAKALDFSTADQTTATEALISTVARKAFAEN